MDDSSGRCRISCSTALHFFWSLTRKKPLDPEEVEFTFRRSLTTLDLLCLGVGSMLGAGVYGLAGEVSRNVSGPSVIISFLVAGVASAFVGLCYAEFGARVPKMGSSYSYSYVTVGEVWAFVTGWNLVLSYVTGTSTVARAWSGAFDELMHNVMAEYLEEHTPMDSPGLANYPDFFAAALIMLLAGILVCGVKVSVILSTVFTGVNVTVLLFIIVTGFVKGDIKNWCISAEAVFNASEHMRNLTLEENETQTKENDFGVGGFFPFGINGTLAGAATCFYAFIGFDTIATTAEEVKNPRKAVPRGIILSLLICFLAYFGVSASLTLLTPYYQLNTCSPLPMAFEHIGWGTAKYVVAAGSLCALSASLLGVMFPMPRVLLSMATDGLLFKPLSYLSSRQSPVASVLCSGAVAAVMVLLLDLKTLVDLSSVGTMVSYTAVAVCVLILRYKDDFGFIHRAEPFTVLGLIKPPSRPTRRTSENVKVLTVIILFLVLLLSLLLSDSMDSLQRREVWSLLLTAVLALTLVLTTVIVWKQPQSRTKAAFMVPGVPLIPILSISINIYLLVRLAGETWISYSIWMTAGLIIYFAYGVHHSVQKQRQQEVLQVIMNRNEGPAA